MKIQMKKLIYTALTFILCVNININCMTLGSERELFDLATRLQSLEKNEYAILEKYDINYLIKLKEYILNNPIDVTWVNNRAYKRYGSIKLNTSSSLNFIFSNEKVFYKFIFEKESGTVVIESENPDLYFNLNISLYKTYPVCYIVQDNLLMFIFELDAIKCINISHGFEFTFDIKSLDTTDVESNLIESNKKTLLSVSDNKKILEFDIESIIEIEKAIQKKLFLEKVHALIRTHPQFLFKRKRTEIN